MKNPMDSAEVQDCTAIMTLCDAWWDDELGEQDREQVWQHIQHCPDCQRYFDTTHEFNGMLRIGIERVGLSAPAGLREKVVTALEAGAKTKPATPLRFWPRLMAFAAMLLLGILIGSAATVSYQAGESASSPDLTARLQACCGLARRVLPDERMMGGYDAASTEYQQHFPGSTLPAIDGEGAPGPRVFGTEMLHDTQATWVVYCDGKPGFPERFVLLTMDGAGLVDQLPGMERLEVNEPDLNLVGWRDGDKFHVLITKREMPWAREQAARLGQA